jgi:PAS domain S-box-containing protein
MAFTQGKSGIYFSNIYYDSAIDKRFEMLISAPAADFSGVFCGVIVFEVDMTTLYKFIQDVTGLGKTGEVLIGMKTGNHVEFLNPLRHDPGAALKRKTTIGDPYGFAIQQAVQGKTGSGLAIDYRGKQVIAAWRYIRSMDWGLVAKIDTQEAFADVQNLRNLVIIILLIVFVFCAIMAFSIAQSISGPITALSKGTEVIGGGDLDFKVGTNQKDEIGRLSRSFDKMTQDLKTTLASRDDLNREIEGRKAAEAEREISIEFLRIVNNCEGLDDLMKSSVRFFKDKSGFEAVGVRLKKGDDFPYFETSGFADEFVRSEMQLCSRDHAGRPVRDAEGYPIMECMCGNVLQGRSDPAKSFFTKRGSFWSNGTTELLATSTDADRQARTRNRCNGEGYESVGLFTLRTGGGTLGLLQLNDRRRGMFTPKTIDLWERLTDYLAVAVSKFMALESLRESEDRFRVIAEASPIQISVGREEDGTILFANPEYERAFGYAKGEIIGRKTPELYADPADRALVIELLGKKGALANHEVPVKKSDGTTFWVALSINRIRYGDENALLASSIDITERKRIEEALRQRTEELRVSNEELTFFNRSMVDREERMIELKKQVNELNVRLGMPPQYDVDFEEEPS